jgi:hypothetical protein
MVHCLVHKSLQPSNSKRLHSAEELCAMLHTAIVLRIHQRQTQFLFGR